jgi:hypothetical protein
MAQKSSQSNRYGIDNLTYDLIAVLHEKAEGMEAFEQYLPGCSRATTKFASASRSYRTKTVRIFRNSNGCCRAACRRTKDKEQLR